MAEKCKECGCKCGTCGQDGRQHCDMHLHAEIENLRQRLLERDNHIVTMETQFLNEADKFPNGELASTKEELLIWQEKYSRLHEAHKRVQKVNQNLEDKLLRIVDKCETEKGAFTKDIATLSHRLADANFTIHRLTQDNEKYRNDVSLAIQLLQCKPSNFVGQKYDSLPSEVQAKVRTYVAQKRCPVDAAAQPTSSDVKSITVPISTFPPTAMVYNITKPTTEKHSDDDDTGGGVGGDECKPPVDVVSAAIMAKVLEDREKERIFAKHCDTCTCHRSILMVDAETQTTCPPADDQQQTQRNRNLEKSHAETPNEKHQQSADKLPASSAHTVFYEINENVANGERRHHVMNGDCAAIYAQTGRNGRSAPHQDRPTEENCATKAGLNKKSSSHEAGKRSPSTFSRLNDLNRLNADKAKPLRTAGGKKCEPLEDGSTARNCGKSERGGGNFEHLGGATLADKEQTRIDIINDRLWKNEWTKWKSEVGGRDGRCRASRGGIELDVINDRDWKNDRSAEARSAGQFTLIEVKSPDNGDSQTEVATSPSFSSDSMVISSSDPSSSCSDVAQSSTGGTVFNNHAKSVGRVTGPRNCLVRVTPGSKNILLDNAGHYKSVLYSSTGKASTALVHAKKASRAGSERSASTSSEDNNSPVLLQDNQLQRVAEWVQSSLDNSHAGSNGEKCGPSVRPNESKSKSSGRDAPKNVEGYRENGASEPLLSAARDNGGNLVTFETLDEHPSKEPRKRNLDYEVKITKEMEETYLKLAASLDPVALSLSSSNGTELTIEKYRKDHRRLHHVQRLQDKAGSKA
ncbi:PREDICTED: uncharacterized protein LOC106752343 [Dinoponera quadriceps]|uniref:Uncharacterized protein LOC106752343 n=1 Tax=Dinoponera quadriceps TaxID=609295 RepID=A0A6P3YHQ5_DINQU|nr:PREDICTED: uncharacterized protein LOC106752343 [Dinoponera quadriceps]